MTTEEQTLSAQLDQARGMEEHYRALLLFWKQRRQSLEAQLPTDGVFDQFLQIAKQAWSSNDRPN